MKTFEGKLVSKQIKIGIVAARFNEFITAKLLSGAMDGLDALLATVQMPSGIPVASVALNGAKNAAWLAAEILALSDDALAGKLDAERAAMAQQIAAKEQKLQKEIEEL